VIFAFVASVSFLLVNVVDPFSGATASPDFAERGERFGGADVQAFDVNGEYTIDVSREGYVVEKKPEVKLAPAATSASSGWAPPAITPAASWLHIRDLDAPTLVGEFDFVDTLRIIGNLLDNAIRHTAPRGVIDLGATREDGCIAFTVADRGPGVEPSERARIFDAFYRPASALPDSGHAGLGLSIAKALAEAQGGALEYRDREGGGSSFVLRLPAAEITDGDGTELE